MLLLWIYCSLDLRYGSLTLFTCRTVMFTNCVRSFVWCGPHHFGVFHLRGLGCRIAYCPFKKSNPHAALVKKWERDQCLCVKDYSVMTVVIQKAKLWKTQIDIHQASPRVHLQSDHSMLDSNLIMNYYPDFLSTL